MDKGGMALCHPCNSLLPVGSFRPCQMVAYSGFSAHMSKNRVCTSGLKQVLPGEHSSKSTRRVQRAYFKHSKPNILLYKIGQATKHTVVNFFATNNTFNIFVSCKSSVTAVSLASHLSDSLEIQQRKVLIMMLLLLRQNTIVHKYETRTG